MNSRALSSLPIVAGLACGSSVPCPPGTHADGARSAEIVELLGRTEPGRRVTAPPSEHAICFGGAVRGAVRPGRIVVLADSQTIESAAARLAHLLAHLHDRLDRFPAADSTCAQQLESAFAAEARGIVAEIEVWHALGRRGDPAYAFASAVLSVTPADRPEHVLARLRAASTDATDELHTLARDYTDRCAGDRDRDHEHR